MANWPPLDPWQWRLSGQPLPDARRIGALWLQHDSGLSLTEVSDARGQPAGLLLGYGIDLDARRILGAAWQTPVPQGEDPDAFALALLRALGGRFLWIAAPEGAAVRLYPDCSAQVPCVFDPQAGVAGSTAHALLDDAAYAGRFDKALYDRLGVDGEGWFPAGLTAHRGLERLLPAHCLDTATWTARRFWPSAPVPQTADPVAAAAAMAGLIRAQIEAAVAGPKRLALALTAGRETRMLLACARPFLDRIDMVTVVGSDRHATDSAMARRIARDMGLRHIELPRLEAAPGARERFLRRGGHCNGDSNARFHPSVAPIADSHVYMGGVGGEVARAFFWHPADRADTPVTARMLTSRMGLPATPALDARLGRWLADLPVADAFQILDIAYLEHRDGAWYAPQFYSDPGLFRLPPLLTQRGVELMLSLPPDWKRQSRMGHEIIAAAWPELLRYPFNSRGWLHDTLAQVQKVAADPRVILKKLRKRR
jgi:hypothetical protein